MHERKIPQPRCAKLRDAARKHHGNPTNYLFYEGLLAAAEAGGLDVNEVDAAIKAWLDDAKPYGQAWVGEVRRRALKALGTARPYANLTLELAEQADKEIGEEQSLEQKATVVAILAGAARLAGKADIARTAEARSTELESRLDQEYRKKVPPFAPEKFAGRNNPRSDRVVLLELFTGAQCPPCVAADVAFDALLQTYQPTELIGMQYHLHIPGPDPLTNKDSMARQQYYGDKVGGTPSVIFNGDPQAARRRPNAALGTEIQGVPRTHQLATGGVQESDNPCHGQSDRGQDQGRGPGHHHPKTSGQSRASSAAAGAHRGVHPLHRHQQAPVPPSRGPQFPGRP